MSSEEKVSKSNPRFIISLIACILVGLTFLLSGSGKLIAFGEIPGQTAEFIGYVLPDAWLTTTSVFIIYDIFIPWIIPVAELALGILLLVGFMPRLMAILCLPLTLVFMANNAFSISIGLSEYSSCECFGIWEEIFGTLTPVQSLGYDIVLFALALVIIFVFPAGILQSQRWLRQLGKKKENATIEG
jgi:uncharacterized membrane protein YphA (DoxX/SURF4 family)